MAGKGDPGKNFPSAPGRPETDIENLKSRYRMLLAAVTRIDAKAIPTADIAEGHFGYVSIDIVWLHDLIAALAEQLATDPAYRDFGRPFRPCSYVEVGCGTGRSVLLVRSMKQWPFRPVRGFDILAEFIDAGRRVYGLGDDIFCGDAMTHDFSADEVIFSYRPFSNDQLERRYEQRLAATMPQGGYLLAPRSIAFDDCPELTRRDPALPIWCKRPGP